MGVIPSVPSALLLALVSSYGEPGRAGETKGATAVRRSTSPKPSELESFLQMNSEERFDLEVINSVNSNALVEEAHGDKRVLKEIVRTAEALLPRVGAENVAGILQFALGPKRPRLTQQVAQAYLDDLAARVRTGDQPLPLERLSDLARRNGSAEVNMTLAELFRQDGVSSLTVLDSRF